MPYGRSYKKAKKAVKKYANKRVAKKIGYKIGSKFIPGLNVVSTADDVYWLGSRTYRFLKNRQVRETDRSKSSLGTKRAVNKNRSRKRYGIDDYY